jgi:hypothetical protein
MSHGHYPVSPLAHWLDLQKTHHVFAKHYYGVTSLRMCKLHRHKENTAAVLLAICVLWVLPSKEFTCHNLLSRVGYVTRQITSRRLGSSKFIEHSLLHLHNLQFHSYCHLQCHNYFCCSNFHSLDITQ